MASKKLQQLNNELYANAKPFSCVYPEFDIRQLPSWLQEQIKEARVYGNDNKGVILPDGQKYHLNNTLNDLNGRDWTLFINSVFFTHYPTTGKESYAHSIRKIHPTPKPPQLMRDLIKFFTKEGELVFDCFMGVGGTLLGASLCNRNAAGIDLNSDYIKAYKKAAKELNLPVFKTECGDAKSIISNEKKLSNLLNHQKIGLLLIDPPYFNMMSKKKTGGDIVNYGEKATPFTASEKDLGNMSRTNFFDSLKHIIENVLPHMKTKGHVIVFIKDLQPQKKQPNLLHADIVNCLNEIPNLNYKGMKIWADSSAKPFPYGYPFSFVANQIHQYILVFRKEK